MAESKPHVYLFIDASNFHYPLKEEGWRIDWQRFLSHGDGDFDKLIRYLKGHFKKVVVIAHKSQAALVKRAQT